VLSDVDIDGVHVEAPSPSFGDKLFLALAPVGTLSLYAWAYVRWQSPTNGSDNFLNAQLDVPTSAWFEVTLDALPWLALALLGRARATAMAMMVFAGLACVHLLGLHFVAEAFADVLSPTSYAKWHNPWTQVHAAVLVLVLLRTMQLVWRHRGAHESAEPVAPRLTVAAVVLMIVGAWVQWGWGYCQPIDHFEHACIDLPWCFVCVDGQYLLTMVSAFWLGLATRALRRGPAAALVMAIGATTPACLHLGHLVLALASTDPGRRCLGLDFSLWLDVIAVGALAMGSILVWRHRGALADVDVD